MSTTVDPTTEIPSFRIEIPEEQIDDLRRRVSAMRWPTKELVPDRSQGVQLATLQALADYWTSEYDWRKCEERLNALPQFTTEIDGVDIHFIHVRSRHEDALPLIMTHGWPGSVIELLETVGPLTDPTAHGGRPEDAFDLVLPSLPGYGFSSEPTELGWDLARTGRAWAELMRRLGYERYGVQGGDIGAGVSPEVARRAPSAVVGVHVNGGLGAPLHGPDEAEQAGLTALERDRIARIAAFMAEEFGYIAIQSTRPQTLAAGLVDSPVGQLAWIVDKFREWTHPRTALPDEVIDRTKGYFPVPAIRQLDGPYLERVRSALTDSAAQDRGLFNPALVDRLLADPNTTRTTLGSNALWQLALLEMWLQNHGI